MKPLATRLRSMTGQSAFQIWGDITVAPPNSLSSPQLPLPPLPSPHSPTKQALDSFLADKASFGLLLGRQSKLWTPSWPTKQALDSFLADKASFGLLLGLQSKLWTPFWPTKQALDSFLAYKASFGLLFGRQSKLWTPFWPTKQALDSFLASSPSPTIYQDENPSNSLVATGKLTVKMWRQICDNREVRGAS